MDTISSDKKVAPNRLPVSESSQGEKNTWENDVWSWWGILVVVDMAVFLIFPWGYYNVICIGMACYGAAIFSSAYLVFMQFLPLGWPLLFLGACILYAEYKAFSRKDAIDAKDWWWATVVYLCGVSALLLWAYSDANFLISPWILIVSVGVRGFITFHLLARGQHQ